MKIPVSDRLAAFSRQVDWLKTQKELLLPIMNRGGAGSRRAKRQLRECLMRTQHLKRECEHFICSQRP